MNDGWQINTAPWVLGVAGAFVLASVLFFFRSLKREGSDGAHIALHLLRLIIALAVALTLLRPERVVTAKHSEQPRVLVLWDGSGSMNTKDVLTGEQQTTARSAWASSARVVTRGMAWCPPTPAPMMFQVSFARTCQTHSSPTPVMAVPPPWGIASRRTGRPRIGPRPSIR